MSVWRLMTSWRVDRGSVAAISSRSDSGTATGCPRLPRYLGDTIAGRRSYVSITARTVSGRTKGMSPGSTSTASPRACATPSWIEENIPREGSGFSIGRTRGSRSEFTSRSSSVRASFPTTTITSAAPPSRSARIVRSSSGSPSIGVSSLRPPNRSAEPAAGTTATVRISRGGSAPTAPRLAAIAQAPEGALGEHARGALALRDRPRCVVHRPCRLVHRVRGSRDGLVFEARADDRLRGGSDEHGPRRNGGDRDARVADGRALETHGRGEADDGEVERVAIAQLEVGAAPVVLERQLDRRHDVAPLEGEVADAVLAVEVGDRDTALSLRVRDDGGRAERDKRGHRVGARDREAARGRCRNTADDARVRLHAVALGSPPEERLVVPVAPRVEADVPADRAHVAELRSAHDLGRLGERRVSLADAGIPGERRQRGSRADHELTVLLDAGRVPDVRQRHEDLRRELAALHVGEEIRPTGHQHHAERGRTARAVELAGTVIVEELRRLTVSAG